MSLWWKGCLEEIETYDGVIYFASNTLVKQIELT